MNKTCVIVKAKIKNKKIIEKNQITVKKLNDKIRKLDDNVENETMSLLKLQTFIDKSDQPLKMQLKVMTFA